MSQTVLSRTDFRTQGILFKGSLKIKEILPIGTHSRNSGTEANSVDNGTGIGSKWEAQCFGNKRLRTPSLGLLEKPTLAVRTTVDGCKICSHPEMKPWSEPVTVGIYRGNHESFHFLSGAGFRPSVGPQTKRLTGESSVIGLTLQAKSGQGAALPIPSSSCGRPAWCGRSFRI